MTETSKQFNVVICEIYKEEIECISDDFKNVDFYYFPCSCNRRKCHAVELTKISEQIRKDVPTVILASRYCIKNQDKKTLEDSSSVFLYDQCKEIVVSEFLLEELQKQNAYTITSGWLKKWKETVLDEWGFNVSTAKEFFNESSDMIVYLKTLPDDSLDKKIKKFSEFVDLPYKTIPVGTEFLELFISNKLFEIENEYFEKCKDEKDAIRKQLADISFVNTIMSEIAMKTTEKEVIEKILDILQKLFAPEEIYYLSISDGDSELHSLKQGIIRNKEIVDSLRSLEGEYGSIDNSHIWFKINYVNKTIGIVEICNIAFPEYIKSYLNVIINVQNIFGLAVENAKLINRIENLSLIDPLTEVYNRRGFFKYVDDNSKGTVVIFDIDKFKKTNDTYGHQFGDKVLTKTVRVCKSILRSKDILARYGGDEFVIYLPETTKIEAEKIVSRIDNVFKKKPIRNDKGNFRIKLSFGISELSYKTTLENALKHADVNLYKAKNSDEYYYCSD
ncbi:MAG: diguanylate cyclase [Kosmotoga sp.]|nr:MAG: diguanylate cyclase [Kosmotoga sp.]